MPIQNIDIIRIFEEIADLLEIKGENPFRIRAYRNAAQNIGNLGRSLAEMVRNGEDLDEIPGIGEDLAQKIIEIVETGKLLKLEELKKDVPESLITIMSIEGLGPKKAKVLYEKLGITNIAELEKAARERLIEELPGFGEKTQEKILKELIRKGAEKETKQRIQLAVAEEIARPLLDYLKGINGVKQVEIAGSYRRGKETVGDLDILVTHKKGLDVMQRFVEYEDVEHIIAKGETKSSVVLKLGLQVDLRVVPENSYGAALHYFTGSKEHNIIIRKMGIERGLKVNEYGIFRGEKRIAGKTENEVFQQLGLPYIEPEIRENNGEIEAALRGKLPELIKVEDIRGDLHVHTTATDGHASLEEMVKAAIAKKYEYLAICDHSKHVAVANGLDEKRLSEQIEEIDRLQEKYPDFKILKSIEVDILEDGSLDLPDSILKKLDMVVGAVHYKFNMSSIEQTERIIRGINNPYVNILSHPTGRLINQREPYELDIERLMQATRDAGCILEVNSQPDRLDLNDVYCRMAKEMGVMLSIATDAHSVNDLNLLKYGIKQARRGWLEAKDVINTRGYEELKKILKK